MKKIQKTETYAILLAGGEGKRYRVGKVRKEFVSFLGKPLFLWSLETLLALPEIEKIVVVFPEGSEKYERLVSKHIASGRVSIFCALKNRHESIRGALLTLPPRGMVVVQDGISPLTSLALIRETLKEARRVGAATASISAIYRVFAQKGQYIDKVLERSRLAYTVSPQAFSIPLLHKGLEWAKKKGVTDRAMVELIRKIGKSVGLVRSPEENIKLTFPHDALTIEALLRKKISPNRKR
ncbi:MAG: 2-C-methyl-D-erythritol 4-phosphate cytidylyltransferase [Candidatus Pacebacteria bacterium]|nr:2-C-methyl-D-erythritol 4-phosphate cytidylyltransferase [Candidatus Paceibacterota bacterium]